MSVHRLSRRDQATYDVVSREFEANPETIDTSQVLTGAAAAEAGRSMLEAAFGGSDAVERALGGRPPLTPEAPKGHRSPVRSLRLPDELSDRLDAQALAEGRRPSDVLRDALAEYLDGHRAG